MLIHLLPRAVDRVLLRVEQVLDEHDQLDLASLVHAVAGAVLGRAQKPELALPISEHVRLEAGQVAHLADGEKLLHRVAGVAVRIRVGGTRGLWAHESTSARSSRDISSAMASRGWWRSNKTRYTAATMGISMPKRAARACALWVVTT